MQAVLATEVHHRRSHPEPDEELTDAVTRPNAEHVETNAGEGEREQPVALRRFLVAQEQVCCGESRDDAEQLGPDCLVVLHPLVGRLEKVHDGEQLAAAYEKDNKIQYSPPLAYIDAQYDILFDALQRAGTKDKPALLKALKETSLETVVGTVKFNDQNFSVTPLGGAQWHEKDGKLVKENVYNEVYPQVKKTSDMRLYAN